MYQPNSIKTLLKLKTQYNNSGEKWTNIDVEEQKENKNTQPKQIQQHKRANSSKPGKRETPLKKIQSSKLEERANSQEKKKQSQQILPYEDDVLNPRNFHNNLYQDDNFMYMKEQMAYSMINLEVNITKERKELMYDVDYQLQDLQDWKKKQKNKQEWFKEEEEKIQQQYEREIERKHINKYDDLDLEQKIYEDYINRHSSQIDFIDHWKQKKENNIKSLHNKQVHSQINEKLNNKEEEIQRIERYLKESKKGDSSQINKNKINSSIMENQEMNWAKQEQMYNQFVEFENQVNQFDEEINGLLFGKQTQKQDVTDDEINDLLKKIKEKEALQKNFKSNQPGVPDDGGESDKINSILNDIENEFKELDDLLKEVDELQKGEEMVAPGVPTD